MVLISTGRSRHEAVAASGAVRVEWESARADGAGEVTSLPASARKRVKAREKEIVTIVVVTSLASTMVTNNVDRTVTGEDEVVHL